MDCIDCEWIDTGTFGEPTRRMLVTPCSLAHAEPLVQARAELDDIDRATGLDTMPYWRPLVVLPVAGFIQVAQPVTSADLHRFRHEWATKFYGSAAAPPLILGPGVEWTTSTGPK